MANGAPTVSNGLVISGVTTSTSFSGDGSALTGITQTTINNNADNRLITGSGTANTLEGEATFTYDGVNKAKIDTSQTYAYLQLDGNSGGSIEFYANGSRKFELYGIDAGIEIYDRDKGAYHSKFLSGGDLEVSDGKAHIKGSGELLRLQTNASGGGQCYIDFDDETATRASIGMRGSSSDTLTLAALNGSMRFDVQNKVQALNITSDGQVLIGTNTNPTDSSCNLRVNFDQNTSSGRAIEITHNTNGADKAGAALGLAIANGGESTNAADLTFQTASNGSLGTRMTISSDGQVTTPAQCSFRATKSGGGFNNGSHIFVWDQIQHNVGSNYNNSNGRFTAPIDGTYILYAYSIYQNNASNDTWDFRKNGSTFPGSRTHFTYNGGSAWDHVNHTMIISLSANDYIEVYATDQNYHGGDWTAFCGHLLG